MWLYVVCNTYNIILNYTFIHDNYNIIIQLYK